MYIYYSNITAADMRFKFKFLVGDGSLFMMKNSGFYGCGHVEDGYKRGLRIDTDYNATLIGNVISNGYHGIFLICSGGNVIANNTIVENLEDGIFFDPGAEGEGSNDNLIANNTIINNDVGIRIKGSRNNKVVANIVRDNKADGIAIEHSNDNVIKHNDISENVAGIKGFELSGNLIEYNRISYNEVDGISFGNSFNNTMANNVILANHGTGITLRGNNNKIINNEIKENNWDGIQIIGSSDNIMAGNIFTSCQEGKEAIWLASGSSRNMIAGNTVLDVPGGVHLYTWEAPNENNTIFGNVFLKSSVHIDAGSDGNIVYQNNFTDSQARDEGLNRWDFRGRGNYWSNYEGWDEDGDGIGDTSFRVNPNGVDRYPLGPTRSEIACTLEMNSITYRQPCKLYGSIRPSKVGKVEVTLRYSKDGGATWTGFARVTTDSGGNYAYQWFPDAGSYILMASWAGDWRYRSSTSPSLTLEVAKIPMRMSCSVDQQSVNLGESLKVFGSIEWDAELAKKLNLSFPGGVKVSLFFLLEGKERYRKEITTDSEGKFDYLFKPDETGAWEVRAKWEGSPEFEGEAPM